MMNVFEYVLDLIFPRFCEGCGAWGTYLCKDCYEKISFFDFPLCPGCMKNIASFSVHEHCRHLTQLDGLLVCSTFQGPIKLLITDMKYQYTFDMAKTAGSIMAIFAKRQRFFQQINARVLVPVPMHTKKLRERGFNQSELLGKEISRVFAIPMTTKLLQKAKETKSQAGLNRKQRLQNMRETFSCEIHLHKSDTIVVVDDVVTTGATLSECAKALKTAGAGKVYGLVLAHGR